MGGDELVGDDGPVTMRRSAALGRIGAGLALGAVGGVLMVLPGPGIVALALAGRLVVTGVRGLRAGGAERPQLGGGVPEGVADSDRPGDWVR